MKATQGQAYGTGVGVRGVLVQSASCRGSLSSPSESRFLEVRRACAAPLVVLGAETVWPSTEHGGFPLPGSKGAGAAPVLASVFLVLFLYAVQ